MPTVVRIIPRPLALALAALLALVPTARGARAAEAPAPTNAGVRVGDFPDRVARAKREIIMRGARNERRERAERAAEYRRLMKLEGKGKQGVRVQPATPDEDGALPGDQAGPPVRLQLPLGVSSLNAIPTNAPVNNPVGDAGSDTQAEEGIAMLGNNGLCTWNEGHLFGATVDAQQAAYTNNGGASWVDIGAPSKPVGGRWASDPVVTVNEKTGTFYYCGLIDFNAVSQNGIAIVPGTFTGGVFSWGTPRIVRSGPNVAIFFDKQWMVADSTNGNLYISYTTFPGSFVADTIIYQRSTNGGVSWSDPIIMNTDPASYGWVQGSRPAVGPNGEVYVAWSQSGLVDVDYMKLRKSTDAGVSFGGEILVGTQYSNFGTGSPGFNRDHGITFPALAVDRSSGTHRGRVYVTWNESINWYDDPLGGTGSQAEVESNNTTATANAFVPGKNLTGSISASTDLDYFSFSATQGTTYIVWADVPGTTLRYTLRLFCTDGTTRLVNGGDNNGGGGDGYAVWTAPTTGTYYLRMGGVAGTGSYTLRTGVDAPSGGDRVRDMRDAIVAWSDGGTSWTHYVRSNDDLARFDNSLPEVAVSCEGYVYTLWYDYRDSPVGNCGGIANIYLTRSTDGGVSWVANQRVTSVGTNFTTTLTNLQPNMGDYNGMSGGANIGMAWADGRAGSADVWGANVNTTPTVGCPAPVSVNGGDTFSLSFSLQNPNVMFSNDYSTTISSDQPSWTVTPASQNLTLASLGSGNLSYSITVPASSPSGVGTLCFKVSALGGGVCGSCCVPVTVTTVLGVPPGGGTSFALGGAWPNPASGNSGFTISFSLPGSAPATLELLDLGGRRVLAREVGGMGGGSHVVSFQSEAARLPAGLYVVRLSQGGRSATSKVVLVK